MEKKKKNAFVQMAWVFSSAMTQAQAPTSSPGILVMYISGDLPLTHLLSPSLQGQNIQALIPEKQFPRITAYLAPCIAFASTC